jgi:hypothetical protein
MQFFLVPLVSVESVILLPHDPFVNAHLREEDLRLMLVWKCGPRGFVGNR